MDDVTSVARRIAFGQLLKPNKKPNVALLFSEVLMVYLGPVQATVNRSCYVAC